MVRQQTELLIGASEYPRLPGWLLSRTVSFIQTLPRMRRKSDASFKSTQVLIVQRRYRGRERVPASAGLILQ